MTLGLLATLVLLDGTLCGFRAAAGRNARIFLFPYYVASLRRGALVSAATVLVFLGAGLAVRATLGAPAWDSLLATADVLVKVYGVYATLVLMALLLYLSGSFDLGVLASVLVLGPFTLIRPYVIVGGALAAAWWVGTPVAAAFALVAAAVMSGFERLLSLGRPPWGDTLPRV